MASSKVNEEAQQSPINIESSKAIFDENLAKNQLKFPQDSSVITVANNGVTADVKAHESFEISGGPMPNPYTLVAFHFHWQNKHDNLAGSEHTLDGKAFAAELHLVHLNKVKYNSMADALPDKDGLCVLGVFLEITSDEVGHKYLEAITKNFEKIHLKGKEFAIVDPFCPYSQSCKKLLTFLQT